jgi:hypothetical protein
VVCLSWIQKHQQNCLKLLSIDFGDAKANIMINMGASYKNPRKSFAQSGSMLTIIFAFGEVTICEGVGLG